MRVDFSINPIKMTGSIYFLLLILAFCMVNVGQINNAFAHHSTESNAKKVSTVWIRAESSYTYFQDQHRVNRNQLSIVVHRPTPATFSEGHITTVRIRVFAAEGLTRDTRFSTKNDDGVIVGREFSVRIGGHSQSRDPETTFTIPINQETIDEIFENIDPNHNVNERKRTIGIEIVPPAPQNNYHLAGSSPGAMNSADPKQRVGLDCKNQTDAGRNGAPGPRCTTIYFSILDDDIPLVEIKKINEQGVSEDGPAQFMITSDIIPVNPITVPFDISNTSTNTNLNFIDTLDSVTIDGSSDYCDAQMTPQCSVPVDVIIANGVKNGAGEAESANGSFTAQIRQIADDTSGYKVHGGAASTPDPKNSIEVTVFDDVVDIEVSVSTDSPIVSETQLTNNGQTSNNSIVAKFAVNENPGDDLTIYYSVKNQGNSDFLSSDTQRTGSFTIMRAEFGDSFTGREVMFELEDDEIDEQDGNIVVTVEAGEGYISTGADKTQTFQILDDDEPEIRIHNPPTSRSESDTTTFELVASIEPWQPIDVTFSTEGTMGDCLTETRVQTVSGTRPVPVNIIDNDMIDETDCTVVITLTDDDTEKDSGYSIPEMDPDMESLKKAEFTVTDDDIPLIEVASREESEIVGEATDWQFKLTSDIIPVEEITVAFSVTINSPDTTEVGDFFISQRPVQVLFSKDLNCGDTPPCEATFDIINQNGMDNMFSADASFSVELTAVSAENIGKYRIHEGGNADKNTITIQVTDDNLPTVSIRSNKLELKEGEVDDNGVEIPIAIIFSITQPPTEDLTVMYIVNQNGLDFLDPTSIGTKEVIIPEEDFRDLAHPLPITIVNDSKNEKDSIINDFEETRTIDVTLVRTLDYNIMGTAADNTLKFTIRDDDTPVVNISLPMDDMNNPINERSEERTAVPDFNVQITNTNAITELWRPVEVSFTAMETSGDCLNETRSVRVNLTPAGVMIVDDDEVDEIDCEIAITLTATDGSYIIGDPSSTNITINDDDLSLVSFKDSNRNAFSEESETQFIFQIPDPAPHDIPVFFTVTQPDGSDFLNDNNREVRILEGLTEIAVDVLEEDEDFEESFLITVTLIDQHDTRGGREYDPLYEIPEGQNAELMFTAYSDEGASVRIEESGNRVFTENMVIPVMFTANTTAQSISTVTINYSVTEGIENAGSSFLPQDRYTDIQEVMVNISNNSGTKEVMIYLDNDNMDEADGTITVTIEVGAYMVPAENSIEFQVRDNDDPVIQIREPTNVEGDEIKLVTAGQVVKFPFDRSMTEGNQSLDVDIQITQVGNVILWRIPRKVSFQVKHGSIEIDIKTRRGVVPPNASITVTLVENSGNYRIDDEFPTTFTIPVRSSDSVSDENRISVANVVTSNVLDFLAGDEESEEPTPALNADNVENATAGDLKPIISINSSDLPVNEGETIIFQINSSFSVLSNIPIEVRVVGNSKEPDQTALINIQPGQVQRSLMISTVNDDDANEDRTVTATLQPSSMYKLGSNHSATVTISDAEDRDRLKSILETSNQQVLPELFSTTGDQILNAIDGRVQQYFKNNEQNTFELDGNSNFTDIITSSGRSLSNESFTLRDIIGNSSFSLNLFEESNIANSSTFWGIGDIQDISGYQLTNQQSWKGDSFVGQFGLDTRIGEETLAGITYSISDAEVDYINYQDDQISYKSNTSGFHPYFGWKSNDHGIELSIQTGYGFGEVEIEYEDIYSGTLDTNYYTLAVESTRNLLTNSDHLSRNSSELNLIFDSEFSQQYLKSSDRFIDNSQIEFWHIDLATEVKQSIVLSDRLTMDRSLTLGLMREYTNNQFESGIGSNGNVEFSNSSGLKLTGLGNIIIPFENHMRSSIEGTLNFDRNQDQIGIQFELLGFYGNADSSTFESSRSDNLTYFNQNNLDSNETNHRLESEIGFGFSALDGSGLVNPYSGITLTNNSERNYRIGNILKLGSNFELELIGMNSYDSRDNNSQSIQLDGKINW